MKLMVLADINSAHSQKWVQALSPYMTEIAIFSLSRPSNKWFDQLSNVRLVSEHNTSDNHSNTLVNKLKYLTVLRILKQKVQHFNPDIIHAHYATSYGLLGALVKPKVRLIISAWGSDVFDFPRKSFLHKAILKFNLKGASQILSTSHIMKKELQRYTDKTVLVIPFGVDLKQFEIQDAIKASEDKIVIGTIKSLEPIYGIDTLIKAYAMVKKKYENVQLIIGGAGSQLGKLKTLAAELKVDHDVKFLGKIEQSELAKLYYTMDIFVMLSNWESFGVSALEAASCGLPVVASNIGGIKEVVEDRVTGFLVPPQNSDEAAKKIEVLIQDRQLRKKMGTEGRKKVERQYDLKDNINQLMNVYRNVEAN